MSRKTSRSAINSDDLAKQIIELGQTKEFTKLQQLITQCDVKTLERMIVKRIDRSDATILWNYLLIGCDSNSDQMSNVRFSILNAMLSEMNKVELTSKQTFDLITRTFIELPKLRKTELMDLCTYCIESMRLGDPKCTGWKELFPELMKLLNDMPKVLVQNEVKTGHEYCESQIKLLLATNWPEPVLSSIGAMFLEVPLSKNEKALVLNKLCEGLLKLEPQELPTLSFQLFTLSTTPAQLMIPLISLNQYFQKYLYKKQLDQSPDSEPLNFDSIDRFSDNDLVSAQNTVLYHLSNCSEYKISEKEMVQQFRTLATNPKCVLTPFMLSALLTISNVSRYLESVRLSVSSALPFIRTVVQNNEKEVELCNNSAWFRDTLENSTVNVNKVYSILVEQSKEDLYTPALCGLAFVLLKTPHYSSINVMGILFLEEMVKARHQLGYGILRNLKEFLFADQEAPQYTECLTRLSITNPMMISEHFGQIKEIIDFFLLIPGHHAMRMMTFIVPLTKSNTQIREYFIEMLRRAMYQSNTSTRQMAVYGFCLVLKQLRNNSVWRTSNRAAGSTQISISGFSVMSQQTMNSGSGNPNMAFDICVLEIIGILRKCFNQTYEIKEVLYDGLANAVQQNPKLIPHVLRFLEWNFRSYFSELANTICIHFEKAIVEIDQDDCITIQINDHIGRLLQFIARCFILHEHHGLDFETNDLKQFFDKLVDQIVSISLDEIGLDEVITPMSRQIGLQFMNIIEGLMYYCLKSNDIDATAVSNIMRLYKHHKKCYEELEVSFMAAKKALRKKNDGNESSGNLRGAAQVTALKPENVWDLVSVHGFLEAICRRSQSENLLWNERDLCVYILNVAVAKVEGMRSAPEYKQIKYSKSNFKYLCDIAALMVKYFVKDMHKIINDTDIEMAHAAVDCLHECLKTATVLYQRKFLDFLKVLQVPLENLQLNDINMNLINILHRVLDKIVTAFENNDIEPPHQVILLKMFQCLELLYNSITLTHEQAKDVHKWLYGYCKDHEAKGSENVIVHKLLFTQCIRTQKGAIFEGIAKQIETVLEQIEEEPIDGAEQLKSLSVEAYDGCLNQLCNAIQKQINDIEYFIQKVKSYYSQMKTGGQNEDDRKSCESHMATIERRICTQLIFVARVCIHLANTRIPIGSCMDNFTKLLIQFYVCLANLTKHFNNRQKLLPVSYKSTKFDQLVQTVGKKLPLRVYALIGYIELNVFDDDDETGDRNADGDSGDNDDDDGKKRSKKKGNKNHKAKVMRDIKNIPKLILRIENFNKFVIAMSKKTEHDLNKLLHIGTVRDFRIRNSELRAAVEELRKNGGDSDVEDDINDSDDANDSNVDESAETSVTSATEMGSVASSSSTTGSIINEVQHNASLRTSVMKNLNAINKRANKRKKQDIDQADDVESENQRKKKRKDNEKAAVGAASTATNTRRSNRRTTSK